MGYIIDQKHTLRACSFAQPRHRVWVCGNLLCCVKCWCLWFVQPDFRTTSWNDLFICFVFVGIDLPKLPPDITSERYGAPSVPKMTPTWKRNINVDFLALPLGPFLRHCPKESLKNTYLNCPLIDAVSRAVFFDFWLILRMFVWLSLWLSANGGNSNFCNN